MLSCLIQACTVLETEHFADIGTILIYFEYTGEDKHLWHGLKMHKVDIRRQDSDNKLLMDHVTVLLKMVLKPANKQ